MKRHDGESRQIRVVRQFLGGGMVLIVLVVPVRCRSSNSKAEKVCVHNLEEMNDKNE